LADDLASDLARARAPVASTATAPAGRKASAKPLILHYNLHSLNEVHEYGAARP